METHTRALVEENENRRSTAGQLKVPDLSTAGVSRTCLARWSCTERAEPRGGQEKVPTSEFEVHTQKCMPQRKVLQIGPELLPVIL